MGATVLEQSVIADSRSVELHDAASGAHLSTDEVAVVVIAWIPRGVRWFQIGHVVYLLPCVEEL